MKKKLFYSVALFLFSSAFYVANSTTPMVADVVTVTAAPDANQGDWKEWLSEAGEWMEGNREDASSPSNP